MPQTATTFPRFRRPKPKRAMDMSDMNDLQKKVGVETVNPKSRMSKAVAISPTSTLPPHLLMASLLEQVCFNFVQDKRMAQQLFKLLCERLSGLNVMAPLSHFDEMSALRNQHRTMLQTIMQAALNTIEQKQPPLALPSVKLCKEIDPECDALNLGCSRYQQEFQELQILGRGGFGSVYKAKHYLDRREYAVKKIKIKHRNTEKLLKLLREVKALASLQHANIVGYNNAWMEYDNPYACTNSRGSSNTSARTLDDSSAYKSQHSIESKTGNTDFLSKEKNEVETYTKGLNFPGVTGLAAGAQFFSTLQTTEQSKKSISKITKTKITPEQDLPFTFSASDFNGLPDEHVFPSAHASKYFRMGDSESDESSSSQNVTRGFVPSKSVRTAKRLSGRSHSQASSSIVFDSQSQHSINTQFEKTTHQGMIIDGASDIIYNNRIEKFTYESDSREMFNMDMSEDDLGKRERVERNDNQYNRTATSCLESGSGDCKVPFGHVEKISSHRTVNFKETIEEKVTCSRRVINTNSTLVETNNIEEYTNLNGANCKASCDGEDEESSHQNARKRHSSGKEARASAPLGSPLVRRRSRSWSCDTHSEMAEFSDFSFDERLNVQNLAIGTPPQFFGRTTCRSISIDPTKDYGVQVEARNHNYDFQKSITLFIQMELCCDNLKHWLNERNTNFCDKDMGKMRSDNMRIFQQLLEGVDFIHSRGLIHRDLKPHNIFFSCLESLCVKIGDFGLAKTSEFQRGGQQQDLLTPLSENCVPHDLDFFKKNHTAGVGTAAYAAPEVLKGTMCDFKCDIYSLGVILYEMFHIFNTGMERGLTLKNLREKSVCPASFQTLWPTQADAVESLIKTKSEDRPTAKEMLDSPLFVSKDQKIKNLQQTVKKQKFLLKGKDKEILMLKKKLKKYMTLSDFVEL